MAACESCQSLVPDSLTVEQEVNSYARGKFKRVVCVLCKHYLPYQDYPGIGNDGQLRSSIRCSIRSMWTQVANASDAWLAEMCWRR